MRKKKRVLFKQMLIYLVVIIIGVAILIPFFWMFSTSFKERGDIFTYPPSWIPRVFTFKAYKEIWTETPFAQVGLGKWVLNSSLVAVTTSLLSVIIASIAAYAMSRFRFRGNHSLGYLILISQALPGALIIIPLYLFMRNLHLLNSLQGLIVVYTSFALPYATYLLKGYFTTIPLSLDEAALVDGCGRLKALFYIIFPSAIPGIAVTFLFTFILGWNEYLFASVFLNSYEKWTMPVALASFRGQYLVEWNFLFAGSVVITIPVLLLFFLLQKFLVAGFTAGAVKG